MKKIEVTTRFLKDGKLLPIEFSLEEQVFLVKDIGRQWSNEEGVHVLVMDYQENTYHLLLKVPDFAWFMVRDMKDTPGMI